MTKMYEMKDDTYKKINFGQKHGAIEENWMTDEMWLQNTEKPVYTALKIFV